MTPFLPAKKSKYRAKKAKADGISFDSQVERDYYLRLKEEHQSGMIAAFELQPKFELQEQFEKDGTKYRKVEYVADFMVYHLDGSIEVVDVKGFPTPVFKLKKKLFEKKYPYKLSVVTYSAKWGGWIEVEELQRLRRKQRRAKKR